MFQTLRNRLILSHILPLAIILPVLGIVMLYLLETMVYLPGQSNELLGDARLMARLMGSDSTLWQEPDRAIALLQTGRSQDQARLMLLTPQGSLLASSDPLDQPRLNQPVDLQNAQQVLQGQEVERIQHSREMDAEVIDVFVPVRSSGNEWLGVVRLTYRYATLANEFYQLRFLIAILILAGVLAGSALGYLLAVSIEAPIREVTQAVDDLASGTRTLLLKETGPSETRQLAVSVNHLVTRLRAMESARKQLLANLVHELGRPLGALRSAIQALSFGAEKDRQVYQELVSGMDGETTRLQRLLEDLSRLHEQLLGTLELDRQTLRLEEWLPNILRTWQEAARERQLHWQVTIPAVLPTLQADPQRLAQVVGNLISNAIKFTPPGGSIQIEVLQRPDRLGIAVRDSGPGIPPEDQEKIFLPFYRGASGRRFPQGMGLGLSIVRELVDAHGGQLEMESQPGSGSRFTVWLPV